VAGPLSGWRDDLRRLRHTLQEIRTLADGPGRVAADLNATPDVLETYSNSAGCCVAATEIPPSRQAPA
jgi:hypothetical protein